MLNIVSCIGDHLIYLNRKIYFQYIINSEIIKVLFLEFVSKTKGMVKYKPEVEFHGLDTAVQAFCLRTVFF